MANQSKYKHLDPDYVDEEDAIAFEILDCNTLEEAIKIIENVPKKYNPYSLLMFRRVLKEPPTINYETFLKSLDLKECTIKKDVLKKKYNGVYTLYSADITNAEKDSYIDQVINDNDSIEKEDDNDLVKEVLEDLFETRERGIYIRDIAKVPEGYNFLLSNVKSLISPETNPQIEILPGVHVSMLYVALKGSHTAYHIEDQNLCSLNLLITGKPKIWVIVDNKMRATLTAKFAEYMKEKSRKNNVCSQILEHKIYTITPKLLKEWGIPYKIVQQNQGDLFFIRSGAYHTVVNAGRNVAEAVNVGSHMWNGNYDPPVCCCSENNRKSVPKDMSQRYILKLDGKTHFCKEAKCNKSFTKLSLLNDHRRKRHGLDTFTCKECSKEFSKKSNLNRHLKTHENPAGVRKLKKCSQCGKRVLNMSAHVYNVHSDKRIRCEKCGIKVRKTNYGIHVGNCKPRCPYCDKQCRSSRYLKQHIQKKHNIDS